MENNKKNNGGMPARIGTSFNSEIEDIKLSRIKKGKSDVKISTEKITNLIVKSKSWNEQKKDIINLETEELEKLCY